MGKGLEMILLRRLSGVALLGLLAACGPMNSNGLGAGAAARVAAITGLRPEPAAQAPALPTAALAEGPGNVLMVTLLGRNAVAAMTRAGSNNSVETWRTAKGVTLSFRDGILVASRGLGGDLMGANVDGVLAAILRGTGTDSPVSSDSSNWKSWACSSLASAGTRSPSASRIISSRTTSRPAIR
mgnify:CR=1 FL=1